MILSGTRTEYNIDVEVKTKDVINQLYNEFNFRDNYFVEDNKIYKWEE